MSIYRYLKHFPRQYPLSLLVLLLLLASCGMNSESGDTSSLTILTASSLTESFTEISAAFQDQYDVEAIMGFGGSSTLATQLIEGAQADIFASANLIQAQRVQQEGLASGDLIVFAHNELIIITPASNPAGISTPADLAKDQVQLILAAPGVPIREYTDYALQTLAKDESLPSDYLSRVNANVVSEEANVRQVLAKVALGEADAAIVYRSDVTAAVVEQVNVIALPPNTSPTIDYALIILDSTRHLSTAHQFADFVLSHTAQCILAKYQFIPIDTDC